MWQATPKATATSTQTAPTNVDAALKWKNDFQTRTDAEMAIATQFAFDAKPIIEWADSLKDAGITLPIHIGIAGPAKLQTLIKFAIACGVGPSLKVLQKRAMDVTKLLLPYEPTDVIRRTGRAQGREPRFQHHQRALLPAWRHQDQRQLGHRKRRRLCRPCKRLNQGPEMTRTIVESKTKTAIIGFDQPFCVIGERINPTGRKILAEELERGDFSRVEADAIAQVAAGATVLDINSGAVFSNKMAEDPRYADNNFVEPTLMPELIEACAGGR